MNRREFIFSGGALFLASGCKSVLPCGSRPELTFGAISDIHLTTEDSCARFAETLRYFKAAQVDAVLLSGDISDYGVKFGWQLAKRTWDSVFAGTEVKAIFCTGNHDMEGWRYQDMAVDMFANGQDGHDRIYPETAKAVWEEVFGEEWAAVRQRKVKGFTFLSCEYRHEREFAAWMAEHGEELKGDKPFFYFQHLPISGTIPDERGRGDHNAIKPVLKDFPNAMAFTGHVHKPFYDERSIWQGEFTTVAIPSLSYATLPPCENGFGDRNGNPNQTMPILPTRWDLRSGLGYLVKVYADRIILERHDFMLGGEETAEEWNVPLGVREGEKKYAYSRREKLAAVPIFPEGAAVATQMINVENRRGHWAIACECRFPSATLADGTRIHDYEIRVVKSDGTRVKARNFLSPAFVEPPRMEPRIQRFWFTVDDLPRDAPYRIEVVAKNSFLIESSPIYSEERRSVPPCTLASGGSKLNLRRG